ncbi:MAG: signal peptidase I [Treponema sp.]|nr:signal peptidase I [Treponema sp.]MCL2251188.1 signal peptidase I [Treponema sp.]
MLDKRAQYSYVDLKNKRHRLLKFILFFILFIVAYNCLVTFFFSVWVVDNETMQPGLLKGDRLIFTSFTPPWKLKKSDESNLLFKRGTIVLINKKNAVSRKLPLRLLDATVRFFTLQRISLFAKDGQYYIKRVIALPGDEISMNDYVFRIKAIGHTYVLTEFEFSDKPYHPAKPEMLDNKNSSENSIQQNITWDESIPFSGRMDAIKLGLNECFVVSDDRSNTNDSRTWGPVSPSSITARAVLRFWPLNRLELY